jgi:hypothetical protein
MKCLISIFAIAATACVTTPAFADKGSSCHFHGSKAATDTTIVGCANQRKESLIKAGKLDKSWEAAKQDKVEQVDGKKGKEWKVTFKNPAATDKAKETLYMFFTMPGNFIAANFTGQ